MNNPGATYNEQPPGYPEPPYYPPGYLQESKPACPVQPASHYPPQQSYAPQQAYPPQGFVQQPTSSHMSNNTTFVMTQQPNVTPIQIPYVNDHMGLSIFSCLCCCFIIGIIAIIKSSEARNLYIAGDYNRAMAVAHTARNLGIAAIVCGISMICIAVIIYFSLILSFA